MPFETHEQYAQRVYGIAPENLTKAQRDAVKAERFTEMYGLSRTGAARLDALKKGAGLPARILQELAQEVPLLKRDFRQAEVRAVVAVAEAPERPFSSVLDELVEENRRWVKLKNDEVLRFLALQGFDNPVHDPVQREACRRRGRLEKFTGANWEEFFVWDGVRVLHFEGRPREREGVLTRRVARRYRAPDKATHGACQLGLLRKVCRNGTGEALARHLGADVEKLRALVESDHPDETPVEW